VARVAYGMAITNENVSAEIVDWEEFKKLGREYRVRAIPKTFINYRKPFVGTAPEPSILERVMEAQLLP
jgi:hypothetical protein